MNKVLKLVISALLSLSLLVGGALVTPTAQAKNIFDGNWNYGDTVTGPYGLVPPGNWIIIESVPARFPDFYGRSVAKYIGGAPFGTTEGSFSFNVPEGWAVIGRGYQDRTAYQVIVNLKTEDPAHYGLTQTILNFSPIPKGWAVIQKNNDTKVIKNLAGGGNLYDSVVVTPESPVPHGWFVTEVGSDYRKITSARANPYLDNDKKLRIIAASYDNFNGFDEWIATEKTSDGYILTNIFTWRANIPYRYTALRGTYVPPGAEVIDNGDPQYVEYLFFQRD